MILRLSHAGAIFSQQITKGFVVTKVYRVFSLKWPTSMQIYWNKRKRLHKKRIQLPQDWFGTPTWPPFHCFGTPIWPPWRHVKTLYWSYCTIALVRLKNSRLPITWTLANSNPNRFPLDFLHTFTAILLSVTWTRDNSNLPPTTCSMYTFFQILRGDIFPLIIICLIKSYVSYL